MLKNYFSARKKLYPQNVKGKFRSLKTKLNIIFLSIYCLTPFLKFDRGPNAQNQAVLIDIVNSKIYFFFIEIWAQETYYLAGILIISAVTLFFVTSLFGRIWCGYACFQTVWTDIFIAIERFFQGDRNQRIILDRKNNFQKYFRKALTHLCWIIVSIFTGLTFCSYFTDAFTLYQKLFRLEISLTIMYWSLGIGFMTYLMAGFAREHVCTYMCPYARFQSAMFDDNTLIISYDQKRGEPRGKHKQGDSFENRGHCIDCKQCVVVCPTGIDIRNGLQMECIACGLCIDACDDIMQKVGLPKGLIRYDTHANLTSPSKKNKFKLWRFRTFFYLTILITVCSLTLFSLANKSPVEISIIQERNPLYVKLSDGSIRNSYYLKITNKTHYEKNFIVKVKEPNYMDLKLQNYQNNDQNNLITIKAESSFVHKIYLTISPEKFIEINSSQGELNQALVMLEITDQLPYNNQLTSDNQLAENDLPNTIDQQSNNNQLAENDQLNSNPSANGDEQAKVFKQNPAPNPAPNPAKNPPTIHQVSVIFAYK